MLLQIPNVHFLIVLIHLKRGQPLSTKDKMTGPQSVLYLEVPLYPTIRMCFGVNSNIENYTKQIKRLIIHVHV